MFTRLFVASLSLSVFASTTVVMSACYGPPQDAGSDCAPGTPPECCPCPAPEACPDGAPPLPPECLPDAGDGGQTALCAGECVPEAPPTWEGPLVVAIDAAISLAPCPPSAPMPVFEGRTAPEPSSLSCPLCTCSTPTGSCELPTSWTVDSNACQPGGVKTNFDPPSGWDGSCTDDGSISGGKLCGGGPCVRSIWVSPPVVDEAPCVANGDEPMPAPPRLVASDAFALSARGCTANAAWPRCSGASGLCVPHDAGYRVCVSRAGDESCPDGWGERHVFHEQVDDQRTCEPCSCGAPIGGICEVRFNLFTDGACTNQIMAINFFSDMVDPCYPLPSGIALGSKSAEIVDYKPGSCAPDGGGPIGDIVLSEPITFCCLSSAA